jgi:multisubunit Na+/H+ antiporter MnhC subunit
MPTETAIVIAGIVVVFGIFALALAWASYYTRDYRAPGAEYQFPPSSRGAE